LELSNSNYGELAKALAIEIASDGKPPGSRQMASLYLKNTLNAKSAPLQKEWHSRWKSLDLPTRTAIKETLLRAMTSPTTDPNARRFAGIAASEVACVELPYQEWPQFLPAITAAVTGTDAALQAYECLGITCERIDEVQNLLQDLDDDEVPDLPEPTVNALLTTIVQGVTNFRPAEEGTIRYTALLALSKSLKFVHANMERKEERDFIVGHAICGATQSGDSRIRSLAYKCLDTVAEWYYDKLPDYMAQIFQLTVQTIQKDPDDAVKTAAIEFWITLTDTEYEEDFSPEESSVGGHNRYVESAMPTLVPLLLDALSAFGTDKAEEVDEDEVTVRVISAIGLEAFAQCVKNPVVPLVMPFVQQHIVNPQNPWQLRDAAIVAFSCILKGPSTEVMGQYVHAAIPLLLAAFSDPNELIRDDATHCVANICKGHLTAIQPEQIHAILSGLMVKLQESPKLAERACTVVFNMSNSLKKVESDPESNLLSAPMLPLMKALLQAMDRPDAVENHLRFSAMSAAGELITASARDVQHVLRDLLPAISARMEATFRQTEAIDRELKEQMLGLWAGLITSLYQRLGPADVQEPSDRVMAILLQVLAQATNCQEEVFLAVGAIATTLEEDFTKYVSALMPYLITGLRSVQAHSLCLVSVGVVVDICAAVGAAIQPHCDAIMGALTDCLKDATAHRETKPVVFSCFGDIAMAIGINFEPYLPVATMLLMQASQAPIPRDDPEIAEFIHSLRLSLLDAYSGIIMGLADGNGLHLFNVTNVLQFLQFLSTPASQRDDASLEKAVTLLGDLAQLLGARIRNELQQPFVVQLVQEGMRSPTPKTREMALWTQGVVRDALMAQ
jgi:importin subunit beta-1